jgi:arsenical pump membrane protein
MPPLLQWLPLYALPSALSIAATYVILRLTQRQRLGQPLSADVAIPVLSGGGRLTAWGIAGTSVVLLAASAFDFQLGLPTFLAGTATALLVFWRSSTRPIDTLKHVSWGVLPLVAGLFVLVQALEQTGATRALAALLAEFVQVSTALAAWISGVALAVGCNLVNNLPAGLVAGRVIEIADAPEHVRAAVLIGVDLGPNLSVTGSLATILWLSALRRDGYTVSAWTFLKLGMLVMPPALLLAIAATFAFA